MNKARIRPYDIAGNWRVRAVILFLLVLSLTETILCILPAANNLYWPAVAVSMELWPLFIVINVLGLLLIRLKSKVIAAIFALGLMISVWPLFHISAVTASVEAQWKKQYINVSDAPGTGQLFLKSFTDLTVPVIVPRPLQDGILFYSAPNIPVSKLKPTIIDIHWSSSVPLSTRILNTAP